MSNQTYAIVTPLRNEPEGLVALFESVSAQSVKPDTWVLVENGSTDETPEIAAGLAASDAWIQVVAVAGKPSPERAPEIVKAFQAGIDAVPPHTPVVAKVDADITLPPTYFERLLDELDRDLTLGIVSGTCRELDGTEWIERFGTGASVWGAARAYRRACLDQVLPLEPRTAWDWIDTAQANLLGWTTRILRDAPFYHHRREGDRAPTRWAQWYAQGRAAHYLGYRPSYLLARALFQGAREPSALALVPAYAAATLRRSGRCSKPAVVSYVREQQRFSHLRQRAAEARGSGSSPGA